jgi:hypothetical protein
MWICLLETKLSVNRITATIIKTRDIKNKIKLNIPRKSANTFASLS